MSNRTYDIIKYTVQIGLPAIAVLYYSLAEVWGLPLAEEVVGTITAVVTFGSTLLGITSATYNRKGRGENVRETDESINRK